MPNINKLLNKVNQASQAIKSVKGIKSKIESIGYKGGVNTEEVDQLQSITEENSKYFTITIIECKFRKKKSKKTTHNNSCRLTISYRS